MFACSSLNRAPNFHILGTLGGFKDKIPHIPSLTGNDSALQTSRRLQLFFLLVAHCCLKLVFVGIIRRNLKKSPEIHEKLHCGMNRKTSLTWYFHLASRGLDGSASWMNLADHAPCWCPMWSTGPRVVVRLSLHLVLQWFEWKINTCRSGFKEGHAFCCSKSADGLLES